MKKYLTILLSSFCFLPALSSPLPPPIRAWVEYDTVGMIGDAFRLRILWECEHPENVHFPILQEEFASGLQILPQDSLPIENRPSPTTGNSIGSVSYRFSSYQEGTYSIPAFQLEYAWKDTLYRISTDSGRIRIFAPVVDTTLDIKDIRSIFDISNKELWREYFAQYGYWLWILVAIAFITVAIVFLLKRHKSGKSVLSPKKTAVPPIEKALQSLERLKEKQLWQNGRIKEYHTELTDILRLYLAEEFNISALEMTNGELCEAIRNTPQIDKQESDALTEVLSTATLVKFAKSKPSASQHEDSFDKVRSFLNFQKEEFIKRKASSTNGKEQYKNGIPDITPSGKRLESNGKESQPTQDKN